MSEQINTTASLLGDFRNELMEMGFDSEQAYQLVRVYAIEHSRVYEVVNRSAVEAVSA